MRPTVALARLRSLGITSGFLSVTALFFAWGFICSNNDPLIVAVRAGFHLNYSEALLTQMVFFLASGLVSLPAASLGNRLGPVWAIVVSLMVMMLGCLLVRAATRLDFYAPILAALFVLAAGITSLQVAANPLAAALGPPESSHFRLNFAQTFNSLGVVLGVHYGSWIMLGDSAFLVEGAGNTVGAMRTQILASVGQAFTFMAVLLALLAGFVFVLRRRIGVAAGDALTAPNASVLEALRSRWAVFGAIAIGLYVGAEVSIGSIMINFLHRKEILGLPFVDGGRYLANFYWGGALVGRLIGSLLLTRMAAHRLLTICGCAATGLCMIVIFVDGPMAGFSALAIGVFNSIIFPTIFSITLERSDASQSSTSGLLCVAIVGGAVLPLLVGAIADVSRLSLSFIVPACAYFAITVFAAAVRKTGIVKGAWSEGRRQEDCTVAE